ncbi:nucleotide-diphospho-sugar transferase [Panaeolus papilionaceus]|nr:nucleotide-diphospho-sugar transferase [Panaeolus papilionaceus]
MSVENITLANPRSVAAEQFVEGNKDKLLSFKARSKPSQITVQPFNAQKMSATMPTNELTMQQHPQFLSKVATLLNDLSPERKAELLSKNGAQGLSPESMVRPSIPRSRPITASSTNSSTTLSSVSTDPTEFGEGDGHVIQLDRDSPYSTPSTIPSTPRVVTDDALFSRQQDEVANPVSPVSPASPVAEINQHQPPTREFVQPVRPLSIYSPREREVAPRDEASSPTFPEPEIHVAVEPEATVVPTNPEPVEYQRWWQLFGRKKQASIEKPAAAVVAADLPAIILPTPPRDEEKVIYAQTRRLPLYAFGTLSFLSVSVGMWFFAVSSKLFYWFGVFVGLIQVYLVISYMVGYAGKDFDFEAHKKLVEEHSYDPEKPPLVDIYLPCCFEPLEVLQNTYKYIAQLQYPNFKVWVLDDGGLDTVKNLAESFGFNYITRDNKPHLKKAGNLRYAFARTEGDYFVIFDADFCPRKDFIDEMLPYMIKNSDIAIVQSPQFFRPSAEQTWVEQGASATQELFYRIVQVNRDRWGASICVGSNALYRRAALHEVGGTAEIGHSEDVHTGFYALTRGWKLKYIPLALACGVSPDTPRAFFSQQMRWCSGSTTLLTNPEFWKSDLTIVQKVCYMSGMMYYTAAAFMAFLASFPGLLMLIFNPGMVMWFNFAYAFPSLIYSIFVFRLWSRQRYNFNVNFVFVIQQYAYLMAIKDRIFGTTASWIPSGDNKSHVKSKKKKTGNNKYRNMRILCGLWMGGSAVGITIGVTIRIIEGYKWYNFLPLILLDAFNLFIAHRFIFYSK